MPSPFAHIASGYLIYRTVKNKPPENSARVWFLPAQLAVFAGLSILPDIDTLPGLIYGDMHGFHNNYTHSLLTGFIVTMVITIFLAKFFKTAYFSWFPAALASYELHVLMDFFTSERGVKLFWPLYPERIIAPVKLFVGFQWGLGLFSLGHIWTLFTEVVTFLALLLLLNLLQKSRHKPAVLHGATGDD
jgi:membrane-bound metal-dependent hydrolase YbcI (DUF457 family)